MLVQQDVTPQQEAQQRLVSLLEAEHQLLESVSTCREGVCVCLCVVVVGCPWSGGRVFPTAAVNV